MLTLTTKKIDGKFSTSRRRGIYCRRLHSTEGHVAIIVDKDGYTKAQSKAVEKEEALSIFKKLREAGIQGICQEKRFRFGLKQGQQSKMKVS